MITYTEVSGRFLRPRRVSDVSYSSLGKDLYLDLKSHRGKKVFFSKEQLVLECHLLAK